MSDRPNLRALADRCGILPVYRCILDRRPRPTGDATRVALLDAMGLDASTEARAAESLRGLARRGRERILDPVRIVVAAAAPLGTRPGPMRRLAVRLPAGWRGAAIDWRVELREEGGRTAGREGRASPRAGRIHLALPIPDPFPAGPGYHEIRVALEGRGSLLEARQALIVCPRSCPRPRDLSGAERSFGLLVNLYTVRSPRNQGIGDLTDLGGILRWCAGAGGAFVGVNPLHAIRNRGEEISPYSPLSRLFFNPLALDIDAIPEGREAVPEADREALPELRGGGRGGGARLDYEAILAWKTRALRGAHRLFSARIREDPRSARARSYEDFRRRSGPILDDFAAFLAMEGAGARDSDGTRARGPKSDAVRAFRESHPREIDFQRFVQFELDRQIGAAVHAGREAGLALGLVQDLPVGVRPDGFDPWEFPGSFARGVSVGAPPDRFNPEGQVWGIVPLDPLGLARDGFAYWRGVLRASLRHAGALRIDHVAGLRRQFWVPEGLPATRGAYVRYPEEALLGILALECLRHRAVAIGEDLGTVPAGLRRRLATRGVLGTRVLMFERTAGGGFRPARAYAPGALATADTHDLPTLEGYRRGADLRLRARLGILPGEGVLREALRGRGRDLEALERRLRLEGLRAGPRSFARDVHLFLARTPCSLVGLALDDLAGEVEGVNLPGVGQDRHPSWTRRMAREIEELRADPEILAGLAEVAAARKGSLTAPGDRGSRPPAPAST